MDYAKLLGQISRVVRSEQQTVITVLYHRSDPREIRCYHDRTAREILKDLDRIGLSQVLRIPERDDTSCR